jgi:hypothetical protein
MPAPIPFDQRPSRAASQGGFNPHDFTKAGGRGPSGARQSQWIEPYHPSQGRGHGSGSRHPSQAPSQGGVEPPRASQRPSQDPYGPGLSQAHDLPPQHDYSQGTDNSGIDPMMYPPGEPIPGAYVPHRLGPNTRMPLFGGGRGVRQLARRPGYDW